jgi:hypothetical protein
LSHAIPSATSAQIALRTLSAVLMTMGAVTLVSGLGILKRRRRPRADKVSGARAAIGASLLAIGVIMAGLNSGHAPPASEVITPTRFSSSAGAALSIEAPVGWTLSPDRAAGRLVATGGGTTLFIETSLVPDNAKPDIIVDKLKDSAIAAGGSVDESFSEPIDGRLALGTAVTAGAQSSALWCVPRGGQLLTVIVCRTAVPAHAKEACRGALATLRWRTPD